MSQASGRPASVASLSRLTRSATAWWRGLGRGGAARARRSRSQRSTSSNRPVRKSCWSSCVALLGAGPQEGLEPALRQHRDLA